MCNLSEHPELKVPCAYGAEDCPDPLGAAFVVTELLAGTASPKQLMRPEYQANARRIAIQSFEILGRMAAVDADSIDLGPAIATPSPQDVHEAELARQERTLRENEATNRPVIQAALRYLHRNTPPAPDKIAIVHGDYRIGNYLFDTSGVTGAIDWEMVHKGDPLEDLGWALLPNWEFGARPGLTARFLTRDEVIAAWDSTSGLKVDPEALEWWIVYSQVKAAGIWAASRHMFRTGKSQEVLAALVGYAIPQQEAPLADFLRRKPV